MTTQENKEWLHKAIYGYTEGMFRDRYKGILLTEQAMFKMGVVFGFLAIKEEFIDDFFGKLDWMDMHNEVEVVHDVAAGYKHRAPNKITKMSDDGTLFGFGFIQMILVQATSTIAIHSERIGPWNDVYAYGMNGGLIFHGFGNQNFTVDIDSTGAAHWSIHT